jgi:hypothetical protein
MTTTGEQKITFSTRKPAPGYSQLETPSLHIHLYMWEMINVQDYSL